MRMLFDSEIYRCGKHVLFRFLPYSKTIPSSPIRQLFCHVRSSLPVRQIPVGHRYRILRKHTCKRPYEN